MQLSERRNFYRKDLHALYLPIYDKLCSFLGTEWQPYYGKRDFSEQEALFSQGRDLPGPTVTHARGGESAHNYGCATDWTYWDKDGQPLWLHSETQLWKEFGQAVTNSGGDWGGLFLPPDCPHAQLGLKVGWKAVRPVFEQGGMDAAMKFVESQIR